MNKQYKRSGNKPELGVEAIRAMELKQRKQSVSQEIGLAASCSSLVNKERREGRRQMMKLKEGKY